MKRIASAACAAVLLVGACQNGSAAEGAWTSIGPEGGPIAHIRANYTNSTLYAETGKYSGAIYQSQDGGQSWTLFGRDFWLGGNGGMSVTQTTAPEVFVGGDGIYLLNGADKKYANVINGSTGYTGLNPRVVAASGDGQAIYVGDANAGIFVSTDGGSSFSDRSTGLPKNGADYYGINQIVVGQDTPTTAYAYTDGQGIFRTTDGGNTWTESDSGIPSAYYGEVFIDPFDASKAFVFGGDSYIYASVNGSAWTKLTSPVGLVSSMTVDPDNTNTLYALGADGNIETSTDGGSTWSSTGSQITGIKYGQDITMIGGAIVVGSDSGIWRSIDGGTTWAEANSGLSATVVEGISQSSSNPAQVLITTQNMGVFASTDDASTFSVVSGTEHASAGSIVRSEGDQNTVFFAMNLLMQKSTDGGATFTATSLPAESVLAVDPSDPNHILGGTTGTGVVVTNDGGASYSYTNTGLAGNEDVRAIVFDARDSQTVYMAAFNNGLFKSADGGASWAGMGPSGILAEMLTQNPGNPDELYASTSAGFLHSVDSGATWNNVTANFDGIISPEVYALVFDPVRSGVVFAATGSGVFRSIDGGDTWQSLSTLTLPFHGEFLTGMALDQADPSRVLLGVRDAGLMSYTAAVDLNINGGVTASVAPGDKGLMQYSITNQSDLDSADVQVTINVNSNLAVTDIQSTAGSCSMSGSVISCDLGTMAGKTSVGVSFSASAKDAGSYDATATAMPYEHELNASDNKSTLALEVQAPSTGGSGGGTGSKSSGSGGGGGALGLWMLLGLAGLALRRQR